MDQQIKITQNKKQTEKPKIGPKMQREMFCGEKKFGNERKSCWILHELPRNDTLGSHISAVVRHLSLKTMQSEILRKQGFIEFWL